MTKNKLTEKLKEGISVTELEDFTRRHTVEVFSILAIIIATITSCWDFFTGPKLSIFFMALSAVCSILFPAPIERGLKQLFNFVLKQEKSTQMILGAVNLVVAIFVPFILFALLGLLAGSSFHYFVRHAQAMRENLPPKRDREVSGEEHD
jgi:uncharacterized membrane protein